MGAVKYFDLSHNRKSDIIFEWEKVLSFEGNTGPYLQYTYARLKSILRKIDATISSGQSFHFEKWRIRGISNVEHRLISFVLRYPMAIENALMERSPHILAAYLYELASITNEFYHMIPVLREEDEEKRMLRTMMVRAASTTLYNGLNLLGIEAPEEM